VALRVPEALIESG